MACPGRALGRGSTARSASASASVYRWPLGRITSSASRSMSGPTVVLRVMSVPPSNRRGHHVHDQPPAGIQRVVTWFQDHDNHVQLPASRVLAVPLQRSIATWRGRWCWGVAVDHEDHVPPADPVPTGGLREPQLHRSILTDKTCGVNQVSRLLLSAIGDACRPAHAKPGAVWSSPVSWRREWRWGGRSRDRARPVAQFVAQMSRARSSVRLGRRAGLGPAGVGGFGCT